MCTAERNCGTRTLFFPRATHAETRGDPDPRPWLHHTTPRSLHSLTLRAWPHHFIWFALFGTTQKLYTFTEHLTSVLAEPVESHHLSTWRWMWFALLMATPQQDHFPHSLAPRPWLHHTTITSLLAPASGEEFANRTRCTTFILAHAFLHGARNSMVQWRSACQCAAEGPTSRLPQLDAPVARDGAPRAWEGPPNNE